MLSLRSTTTRLSRRSSCAQCLQHTTIQAGCYNRPFTSRSSEQRLGARSQPLLQHNASAFQNPSLQGRAYSSKSSADELLEAIQDQYATAKDEFEIATEETEKKSVYAIEDRKAARDELAKLKEMYTEALAGPDGDEVKRRVGSRIRELDAAVENLNKSDYED
ncbi:hypothetical protein BP6252_08644 [Coleophoma cylindrospora]|uniref:Uncharacterized protein n=1 Tax=Coleophoma cylindrospora TaxID=1849047 RepID=A0A3D8R722_9HELO|nr:hypothetical protein BP6252_08644 [Coleophoma cylindrospora]